MYIGAFFKLKRFDLDPIHGNPDLPHFSKTARKPQGLRVPHSQQAAREPGLNAMILCDMRIHAPRVLRFSNV